MQDEKGYLQGTLIWGIMMILPSGMKDHWRVPTKWLQSKKFRKWCCSMFSLSNKSKCDHKLLYLLTSQMAAMCDVSEAETAIIYVSEPRKCVILRNQIFWFHISKNGFSWLYCYCESHIATDGPSNQVKAFWPNYINSLVLFSNYFCVNFIF